MPRHTPLSEWVARVATRFPDLPAAHARSLAEWSYAMAVTHALQLATLLGQRVNTVRQRLRELFQPGDRKAGHHRTTFDPHAYCRPLVRWVTGVSSQANSPAQELRLTL